GGIGSEWFRGLKPGDAVRFKGPLGGFVFTRADPRRPLFVAEEIGIVPIRAILTELYATGFGRRATLAYWARDPGWLAYDAALRSLARRYPGFAYHPAVAGAAGAARDGASRLAETVTRLVADGTGLVAYVCGRGGGGGAAGGGGAGEVGGRAAGRGGAGAPPAEASLWMWSCEPQAVAGPGPRRPRRVCGCGRASRRPSRGWGPAGRGESVDLVVRAAGRRGAAVRAAGAGE